MAEIKRWASDAAFPPGSDPWSSQPPRVEPADAIKARGFLPGTVPPAGWVNHLFGVIIDESNDQDDRLTAVEALDIQGAFDNSVTSGNNPTIQLKASGAGQTFTIYDASGNPILKVDGNAGAVTASPQAAESTALIVGNAGLLRFSARDVATGSYSFGADDASSFTYKQTAPPSPPTVKSVMRRGAVSTAASDWVPLAWGDTAGGGDGWTATVSNLVTASNVVVSRGIWQRTGNAIAFSLTGTADLSGTLENSFDVALPVQSPTSLAVADVVGVCNAHYRSVGQAVPACWIDGVGSGATTAVRVHLRESTGASSGANWNVTGQYRLAS